MRQWNVTFRSNVVVVHELSHSARRRSDKLGLAGMGKVLRTSHIGYARPVPEAEDLT